MTGKPYTIDDFKIGETVIPLNQKEVTVVIVDIDKERGKIICRLSAEGERLIHEYTPDELEKKFILRPPNILPFPKKKDGAKEAEEE